VAPLSVSAEETQEAVGSEANVFNLKNFPIEQYTREHLAQPVSIAEINNMRNTDAISPLLDSTSICHTLPHVSKRREPPFGRFAQVIHT
jgi:hypothetical protein